MKPFHALYAPGLCALGFGAVLAAVDAAWAQYPTKPITMVVPFAAGGSSDAIARIIAEGMAKALRETIVVENDGGAGGTTATARIARAAPDGYAIIMGNMGTHGAGPAQYPNLKYDPRQDFTPIGLSAGIPVVIVARKDFPAETLAEFVDYVKTNQDKINEAHAGVGSQTHAMCTLLQSILHTRTARVAYRSTGQAINDMVGGQVDFGCAALTSAVGQIQAGTLKAFAIASPRRADVIARVPTTIEAGLAEFQVSAWNAVFGPKDLPEDVLARLNAAHVAALDDAATRKRLMDIGGEIPEPAERTPAALRKLVESEVARWASVMKGP